MSDQYVSTPSTIVIPAVSRVYASSETERYLSNVSFDFGSVCQGQVLEHCFEIENQDSSPLTIRVTDLNYPGLSVTAPREVHPGRREWIAVRWDTWLIYGETVAEVRLLINETESASLTLSATALPPVEVLPYPAVFLSGFRDEIITKTADIVNNDLTPLKILGFSGAGSRFDAAIRTVEEGRRYRIEVQLKSDAPIGQSQELIQIRTDHPRCPVIKVPVDVFVKDEVYVDEDPVDLGEIVSGTNSSETFLLRKRRGPIKIVSIASDRPYLRVAHADTASANTHKFSVDVLADKVESGPVSGTIFIRTDDPGFPEVQVRVQGNVYNFG